MARATALSAPHVTPTSARTAAHDLRARSSLHITPAGWILFLLTVAALYVTKPITMPFTIGVFLSFLLRPVVRLLGRLHMPRAFATGLVMTTLVGGLGWSVFELSGPAAVWMQRLPTAIPQLSAKLHSLRQPMERMDAAAEQVANLTSTSPTNGRQITLSSSPHWESNLMVALQYIAVELVIIIITCAFLLASGGALLERLVKIIPMDSEAVGPMQMLLPFTPDSAGVLRESERQVCLYLAVSSLINCLLGVILALGWWGMGLPNPILWGVVAAVLNFLPYIGPMIGVPLITVVGLLSFDSWHQALFPPLLYTALAFLEGNIITPVTIGRGLAMSPLAIFISTAVWGYMWGFPGALIAVPMLVLIKEFCRRIPSLSPITALI